MIGHRQIMAGLAYVKLSGSRHREYVSADMDESAVECVDQIGSLVAFVISIMS